MLLKHVISAMSYIKRKGYVGEYKEPKKEHAKAVLLKQQAKDLFLKSADVPADAPVGTISDECKTLAVWCTRGRAKITEFVTLLKIVL